MRRTPLLFSSLLLLVVACGDAGSSTEPDASGTPDANKADTGGNKDAAVTDSSATDSSTTDSSTPDGGAPLTIFTILFENHDYKEVVGSPNAPYFNSLIATYGLATNYHDSGTHPSLPNYLVLASGDP